MKFYFIHFSNSRTHKRSRWGGRMKKWSERDKIHNELNWKITQLNIHIPSEMQKVETWMLAIQRWKLRRKLPYMIIFLIYFVRCLEINWNSPTSMVCVKRLSVQSNLAGNGNLQDSISLLLTSNSLANILLSMQTIIHYGHSSQLMQFPHRRLIVSVNAHF